LKKSKLLMSNLQKKENELLEVMKENDKLDQENGLLKKELEEKELLKEQLANCQKQIAVLTEVWFYLA
jgi:hypothetical protein